MFRKLGIAALAVVIGAALVTTTHVGRRVWGLLEVFGSHVASTVESQVPIDVEIARLKKEVTRLDRDIDRNYDTLARELVVIERLKQDVGTVRSNLKTKVAVLTAMEKDIHSEGTTVQYDDGRVVPKYRLEEQFAREWASYKAAKGNLGSNEKLLEQRQELVTAARAKIDEMRARKEQMMTKLAQLETDLEQLRVSEGRCDIHIDDTRFGQTSTDIRSIEDRINARKKAVELKGQVGSESPVRTKVESLQALEEFKSEFGPKADKVANK